MNKHEIIFTARNPITNKRERLHPEDEFELSKVMVVFNTRSGQVTIPGVEATDLYSQWLAQYS